MYHRPKNFIEALAAGRRQPFYSQNLNGEDMKDRAENRSMNSFQ
jgi:hypothetical protein